MILVYFPSGDVDDLVNNRANYQCTSVIVIHFMNGTELCWNIRRTVFNVCICLNTQIKI